MMSSSGRRLDGPGRRQLKQPNNNPSRSDASAAEAANNVDIEPITPIEDDSIDIDGELIQTNEPNGNRNKKKYTVSKKPFMTKKKVLIGILALGLITAGCLAYILFSNLKKVTGDSGFSAIASLVSSTKLNGEKDGRVNILLLGIGDSEHAGASLSDTNIVMSIDPKTFDIAMLSVPRDLYVKLGNGDYGKINAANAKGGAALSEQIVENVTGLPIQYYVQVNFDGFKQAIDAVGGVDITVKQALYDPEYPCDNNQYRSCGYRQAVGTFHMSGAQALKYARCRKGNCGDDFGRAERQQEVIVALQKQAMSASTLSNPVKLVSLVNALGDNVVTNMKVDEVKRAAEIATKINRDNIISEVLSTDPASYLVEGTRYISGAGSILLPKAGIATGNYYDYSKIRDFAKNIFTSAKIKSEAASIQVQNGSGTVGAAGAVTAELETLGLSMQTPENADVETAQTVLYDYTNGQKPNTVKYLEQKFNITAIKTVAPQPSSATNTTASEEPDLRIIIGRNYQTFTGKTDSSVY